MSSNHPIQSFSLASVSISARYNSSLSEGAPFVEEPGIGGGASTAFFYVRKEQWYLVTAWHCVTGSDPNTLRPFDRSIRVLPDTLQLHLFRNGPDQGTIKPLSRSNMFLNLSDSNGLPTYGIHPHYKQACDVAVFPLSDEFMADLRKGGPDGLNDVVALAVNEEAASKIRLAITDHLLVVGYPYGLQIAPVVKKGTLAMDPSYLALYDPPYLLLDIATRQGFSGSPVYRYVDDDFIDKAGKLVELPHDCPCAVEFVGIYTGRYPSLLSSDTEQFGMFKPSWLIDEIIDSGCAVHPTDLLPVDFNRNTDTILMPEK